MAGDNVDLADINYENEKQRKTIQMLTDEKDDKKLLEEFEKVPVLVKRPKDFNYNLVFSDVNFVYDSFDVSLRSVSKIGVAMIGKKAINKKLEGYIEFQYKGGADVFIIYLQTGTKDWVYFEYHPGTLGVLSSYDDINTGLGAIAPDKRRITGENKRFYMYTLGSSINKTDFVGYMADKAKGINRERVVEEIVVPVDSNMMYGDSTYVPENITPEQRQDLKQQEEINNIEKMKMNNQNILSGAPPDRNKPKEEPKQETPAEEVPKEQPKEEVKPETPKQEEIKIEEVPQEEPKKKSKKKGKGDAETETTQPEAPKVETPVQEVPKEEPKVETPKQEEVKIEDVPQEQPKKKKKKGKGDAETETTQPETPNVEAPPVQETPKTEEPK